ncbi:heavy-metal-associated domain-containing protein [Bacillus sp. HMF5848]|uniref:heavy-metal-associated domain-containing protein n=1 Tax=Bacillus sp. HMF5848 TaxID=2495421 RepID=UPI000F7A483E|nr:heavy metal-associated domain-containing protein [Bacillus sp. HMF5848]RSK28082.1 heavy-metal-associated domain-containing protein [Bacillus sp. HMF5848]
MAIVEEKLNVNGMECQSCVNKVEKSLLSVDGVQRALASLDDNKVHIEYDDGTTNLSTIHDVIKNVGYAVE